MKQINYHVKAAHALSGELMLPGDKSISHRSVMLGSIAEGVTEVTGFLAGEDSLATMKAFQQMGVQIDRLSDTQLRIHGVGIHGLKAPAAPLDLGNAGTGMRLLAGLLAGQSFESTLIGDESLSKRPMQRISKPLTRMGAEIETTDGKPPLTVKPAKSIMGCSHELALASAQVKSALLLAGLYADGPTTVTTPGITRDHTERMLETMGVTIQYDGLSAQMTPPEKLNAQPIEIPVDISSAAFFLVAGSIVPGSDLLLRSVGINPTRTGVLDILKLMGADIEMLNKRQLGAEPVADLRVRSAPLTGIAIPESLVPLAIDEFPVLFVAAACAQGETLLTGASELRVKESDRIASMAAGLQALGVHATPLSDGIRIQGGRIQEGAVESYDDHRIAMAFAVAGAVASGPVVVNNCNNVATSFPGFLDCAKSVGMNISMEI